MSENSTVPYLLQLKDAVNAIHLSENEVNSIGILTEPTNITFVPSFVQSAEQICIQSDPQVTEKPIDISDISMEVESQSIMNAQMNIVYEVVYPEQLNLKPVYNLKRGRPKRKKEVEETPSLAELPAEAPKIAKPPPRTRSGRIVRFPKYIEKDFKKIEMEDSVTVNDELDIKISDFTTFDEDVEDNKKSDKVQLDRHQRRRNISAQYRCPKCKKAYLGKHKMIQHIQKYPEHGPVPQNQLNFDVWNYLVDITQKCPPAQRGIKFCEELTNLLHNVLLLTSTLFKKPEFNKNYVEVDKVLGNAIGLPPGLYKFNDSQLYKDVTVLELITNSDFFKPVSTAENMTVDTSSVNGVVNDTIKKEQSKDSNDISHLTAVCSNATKKITEDPPTCFVISQNVDDFPTEIECRNGNVDACPATDNPRRSELDTFNKIDATSVPPGLTKKIEPLNDRPQVPPDLLSDNSLLHLPNLRTSVDELILSNVDTGTNILDNSTSSDELMNVDQFVNERFKKITEPETEMGIVGLNLDLPSLDLFQFRSS